ncbi:MAG: RHS repeat-associated core domain-containing protein, partial [Clostridia bacterium]|nr:RHS repeat-associated core domain-containing protein [Clostridia bacterium]
TDNSGVGIGTLNPIRYRGYYFDEETGLYYLQSRYYDPQTGRFISPDSIVSGVGDSLIGNNPYAYCFNNPINMSDEDGNWPKAIKNIFKFVNDKIVKPIAKGIKATASSFEIEIGVGYGLGVSASANGTQIKGEAYHDSLTIGYDNSGAYTTIKGSVGVSITSKTPIIPKLGPSTEYSHRFETNSIRSWDPHTTITSPQAVYNCPKTKKQTSESVSFIGFETSLHIGIGGHFKAGFNVDKFIEILNE